LAKISYFYFLSVEDGLRQMLIAKEAASVAAP
jgi:hypothetical protein